jgi:hypothetical protein
MKSTKFEVGKSYKVQSICDSGCVFSYEIVKRTEKCVWILGHGRKAITLDRRGVEQVYPEGRLSMAPRIVADRDAV